MLNLFPSTTGTYPRCRIPSADHITICAGIAFPDLIGAQLYFGDWLCAESDDRIVEMDRSP
jgi:hypothetical protein